MEFFAKVKGILGNLRMHTLCNVIFKKFNTYFYIGLEKINYFLSHVQSMS